MLVLKEILKLSTLASSFHKGGKQDPERVSKPSNSIKPETHDDSGLRPWFSDNSSNDLFVYHCPSPAEDYILLLYSINFLLHYNPIPICFDVSRLKIARTN